MPVWDVLWVFMVWSFYVLAWIGALILIFAVGVGLAAGIRALFRPREDD